MLTELEDIRKHYVYTLSFKNFVVILLFLLAYSVISILACVVFSPFCMPRDGVALCGDLMLSTFPFSLLGSSLHYIRKLYLISFHTVDSRDGAASGGEVSEKARWSKRASILYFTTRPLLVCIASSFLVMGALLGFFSIMIGDVTLTGSGCRMVSVLSFMIGASGGGSLDALFDIGPRFLDLLVGRERDRGEEKFLYLLVGRERDRGEEKDHGNGK